MECRKVQKDFKMMGMKGFGRFEDFGSEVPEKAQQLMARKDEIRHATNTEIALYEPKREADHVEGHFYVGLLLADTPDDVPAGMEYVEESRDYVTARGNLDEIGTVHQRLAAWSKDQGYSRDAGSMIVEIYHPMPNGGEEVEVYLPVV